MQWEAKGLSFGVLVAVALSLTACNVDRSTPVPSGSSSPLPRPSSSGSASPGPSAAPSSSASPHASPTASAHPTPTGSASPAVAVPSPIDSNHVAFVVKLASEAMTGAPHAAPGTTFVYVVGQQTSTGANATCSATNSLAVDDAHGDTEPFVAGHGAPAIPFYGNGRTSGTTSQVIQLPVLCSARIYVSVNGRLNITSLGGPAPWAASGGASGFPTEYDTIEYTMPADALAAPSMDVDTTQENMIGLDLAMSLEGKQFGTQITGLKGGFMTHVSSSASAYGKPWSTLINAQWPTRLLSPLSAQYVIGTSGNKTLPGFDPGTFLDAAIEQAWNGYQSPNCMNVTVSTATKDALAGKTLYGQVDASGNFDFYDPAVVTTCASDLAGSQGAHVVAQIPSPFAENFWISNVQNGWSSATGSEFMEDGPFLLPASAPASGGKTVSFVNPYAKSSADIGNTVATALNRGVFDRTLDPAFATQPYCPSIAQLYPAKTAPAQNLWATAVWNAAKDTSLGFGQAYAIPYDDKCGFSTDIKDSGARVLTITVNAD